MVCRALVDVCFVTRSNPFLLVRLPPYSGQLYCYHFVLQLSFWLWNPTTNSSYNTCFHNFAIINHALDPPPRVHLSICIFRRTKSDPYIQAAFGFVYFLPTCLLCYSYTHNFRCLGTTTATTKEGPHKHPLFFLKKAIKNNSRYYCCFCLLTLAPSKNQII